MELPEAPTLLRPGHNHLDSPWIGTGVLNHSARLEHGLGNRVVRDPDVNERSQPCNSETSSAQDLVPTPLLCYAHRTVTVSPEIQPGGSFQLHDDGSGDFRKDVDMRTMIILATVAFGAMRLVLWTLFPAQHLELAGEWVADE